MEVWEYDPAGDLAALERLAEECERFSPIVGWETDAGGDELQVVGGGSVGGGIAARGKVGTEVGTPGKGTLGKGKSEKSQSGRETRGQIESAKVELVDWLFMDVTGIGVLFGGEEPLLAAVLDACRQRGYVAHGVVADTVGGAWGVTQGWQDRSEEFCARVVPPGDKDDLLERLPLAALRIADDVRDGLRQLGVERLGQLKRLPRASLAARFGAPLLWQLDQTLGSADGKGETLRPELIRPYRPPPEVQAEWALEEPIDNESWLTEILRTLLERIAEQLAPRRRGVVQLAVRLDLDSGRPWLLRLNLFAPSGSPRHWEELVRLRWERSPRAGKVGRMTVQASLTSPLESRQRELFALGGGGDRSREWGALVERLASRLGDDAVLGVELRREGLPEREYVYRPWVRRGRDARPQLQPPRKARAPRRTDASAGPNTNTGTNTKAGANANAGTDRATERPATFGRGIAKEVGIGREQEAARETTRDSGLENASAALQRPLTLEPQPRRLEVIAVAPGGPPQAVRWRGVWRRVARWWGPERFETGWWRGPSVRRDYYRIETEEGERWWLFREGQEGSWYLHGVFG